jgi:DNA-binding NarL/FixJ family response regulator
VQMSVPVSAKKKIFIVDDHAILREGLGELINRSPDLQICGEAAGAMEALERIESAAPDLTVVDLSLPGVGGLDLIKLLKTRHPKMPILVLSMHDESIYAERAVRAGARGYIMKQQAIGEVQSAIRQLLDGELYLSPKLSRLLAEAAIRSDTARSDSPINRLSDRELEVFRMIGRWQGPSDIARQLGLSVKTIETYQAKLKEKLGLKDSSQLFQHALKWIQENEK